MSISKKRRKEIEDRWQLMSTGRSASGHWLCNAISLYARELSGGFDKVWDDRPPLVYCEHVHFISDYLGVDSCVDQIYLLRALTLNMLLDDN